MCRHLCVVENDCCPELDVGLEHAVWTSLAKLSERCCLQCLGYLIARSVQLASRATKHACTRILSSVHAVTETHQAFPAIEHEVLTYWANHDTFRKSIANRDGCDEWVFYDGPPFANGLPHYGHLLTGFVKDSAAALRALDVVVHGSTAPEPFGLVIAEAMACGRTVIVSDSGGVAEVITGDLNHARHSTYTGSQ